MLQIPQDVLQISQDLRKLKENWQTRLVAACEKGDVKNVEAILAETCEIKVPQKASSKSRFPRRKDDEKKHEGASGEASEDVSYSRVRHRRLQEIVNQDGRALWAAASGGYTDIAKLLLETWIGTNRGNIIQSAIVEAVTKDHYNTLDALIEGSSVNVYVHAANQNPAILTKMVSSGLTDRVQFLLSSGASAVRTNPQPDEKSFIVLAVENYNEAIVKLLLEYEPKVNADNAAIIKASNSLALHQAVYNYTQNINSDLEPERNKAIASRKIIELLVAHRVNINDNTLVLVTINDNRHSDLLRLILGKGLKVPQTAKLKALLETACCYENPNLPQAKLLLERVDFTETQKNEMLEPASTNGSFDVVKLLLAHKANVRFNNDQALRSATKKGHRLIVLQLLKHKADPNHNYYDDINNRWVFKSAVQIAKLTNNTQLTAVFATQPSYQAYLKSFKGSPFARVLQYAREFELEHQLKIDAADAKDETKGEAKDTEVSCVEISSTFKFPNIYHGNSPLFCWSYMAESFYLGKDHSTRILEPLITVGRNVDVFLWLILRCTETRVIYKDGRTVTTSTLTPEEKALGYSIESSQIAREDCSIQKRPLQIDLVKLIFLYLLDTVVPELVKPQPNYLQKLAENNQKFLKPAPRQKAATPEIEEISLYMLARQRDLLEEIQKAKMQSPEQEKEAAHILAWKKHQLSEQKKKKIADEKEPLPTRSVYAMGQVREKTPSWKHIVDRASGDLKEGTVTLTPSSSWKEPTITAILSPPSRKEVTIATLNRRLLIFETPIKNNDKNITATILAKIDATALPELMKAISAKELQDKEAKIKAINAKELQDKETKRTTQSPLITIKAAETKGDTKREAPPQTPPPASSESKDSKEPPIEIKDNDQRAHAIASQACLVGDSAYITKDYRAAFIQAGKTGNMRSFVILALYEPSFMIEDFKEEWQPALGTDKNLKAFLEEVLIKETLPRERVVMTEELSREHRKGLLVALTVPTTPLGKLKLYEPPDNPPASNWKINLLRSASVKTKLWKKIKDELKALEPPTPSSVPAAAPGLGLTP